MDIATTSPNLPSAVGQFREKKEEEKIFQILAIKKRSYIVFSKCSNSSTKVSLQVQALVNPYPRFTESQLGEIWNGIHWIPT